MAIEKHPCANGLTAACFKAEPLWAKQAFAYRLITMLAPPAITRRLQKRLEGAYIFSGLGIPPGLDLPPGFVLPPGYTFPPGWKIGDPWPPGFFGPAIDWNNPPAGSMFSPLHLQPWQPAANYISFVSPSGDITYVAYSSTGDGHVYKGSTVWLTARNATDGTSFNTTDMLDADCIMGSKVGISYPIRRSFFYFNLSAIPPSKTVISVVLFIRGFGYDESNVCVQEGTQTDPLGNADFDAFTGPIFVQQPWTYSDNFLTLNAAGIAYIQSKLGSIAKLCLREYNHDYLGPAPSVEYRCGCYFSNTATVARRPTITLVIK